MYRNHARYLATEQDRQTYRRGLLACAIVYGLPLLYLVGLAMLTGSSDVPHRDAAQASLASALDQRPAHNP